MIDVNAEKEEMPFGSFQVPTNLTNVNYLSTYVHLINRIYKTRVKDELIIIITCRNC